MKKAWRWISAVAHWLLVDAWRFWAPILVVLVTFIIGYQLPGTADDRVRYCGLALQLLGILTVVHGLRNRRRLFNRLSLVDQLRGWLGRHPRWGAKSQTISVTGVAAGSAIGNMKASVWRGVLPEASFDARLAALEANVDSLRTDHAETARELQEEATKRIDALNSERQMRESAIREIRTQLDTLGVGDLHLEMAGVFWLILGLVLATVPSEIVSMLKWLQCA